jgi:hypothetical protein
LTTLMTSGDTSREPTTRNWIPLLTEWRFMELGCCHPLRESLHLIQEPPRCFPHFLRL